MKTKEEISDILDSIADLENITTLANLKGIIPNWHWETALAFLSKLRTEFSNQYSDIQDNI
jgi:hypothetical protein